MHSLLVTFIVSILFFYIIGINLPVVPSLSSSLFVSVYGHANPITYQPQPNEIFGSAQDLPDQVLITYTETPEPRASSLKVVNQNNVRVDNNDFQMLESNKALSVSLDKSKMDDGIYTVDWLVLSRADGHITRGSYVFSIDESVNQNQTRQQLQQLSNLSNGYSRNISLPAAEETVDLQFDIFPLKVGQNTFNLTASYPNGTGVDNIRDVYLEFNNPSKNLGPIIEIMNKTGSGEYSLSGSFLSQSGNWEIKMTVQRIGEYDINQEFDVELN